MLAFVERFRPRKSFVDAIASGVVPLAGSDSVQFLSVYCVEGTSIVVGRSDGEGG